MIKIILSSIKKKLSFIKNKKRFGTFGEGSSMRKPLRISHGKNIYIGKNVEIHDFCWLAANPLTNSSICELRIEDGSVIGDFCHIYATKSIIIHRNVLFANSVYVSDNSHGYFDINIPIIKQDIIQKKSVEIGEGSWIGEHVCIIGSTIGKNCIIGANSVVTRDIPDYCVAVGSPARVIKQYNPDTDTWISTHD